MILNTLSEASWRRGDQPSHAFTWDYFFHFCFESVIASIEKSFTFCISYLQPLYQIPLFILIVLMEVFSFLVMQLYHLQINLSLSVESQPMKFQSDTHFCDFPQPPS